MKPFIQMSRMHVTGFLLALLIFLSCKKDAVPIDPSQSNAALSNSNVANLALPILGQSQTKTASRFNDYGRIYVDNFTRPDVEDVAFDDNSYAISTKLSPKKNAMIILQGFLFEIPSNATIMNIYVSAIRFKKGRGLLRDFYATLVKRDEGGPVYGDGSFMPYGTRWTNPEYYADIETVTIYSQAGEGTYNNSNIPYLWTPSMINHTDFGVQITTYGPPAGSATLYYEQVEITVEFSTP